MPCHAHSPGLPDCHAVVPRGELEEQGEQSSDDVDEGEGAALQSGHTTSYGRTQRWSRGERDHAKKRGGGVGVRGGKQTKKPPAARTADEGPQVEVGLLNDEENGTG